MASREMVIVISAKDLATKQINKIRAASKQMGQALGRNFKKGALIATAALATLTFAMVKAVKAANQQENAEKSLTVALGKRSKALLEQASALQKVTIFGDETIIQAQALIGAFIKDEEQIKKATKATLDLAAAKGMSLVAAADLVSKTLGSTTNAMSRYGIQVEGAVGSTERLTSLTENIDKVFGGQAQAQAQTFGGVVQQMSNAFGDLLEQLGFLITKNTFVIKAVAFLRDSFASLATNVEQNRLNLMNLVKTGIVNVVKGIGTVLKVMKFFHNAWNGLKIAANGAIALIVGNVSLLFEGLRALLIPFDAIFKGMVKLGAIETNPFDVIRKSIDNLKISTVDVLDKSIEDALNVNDKYDAWGNTITGITSKLQAMDVAQAQVAETAAQSPIVTQVPEAVTTAAQLVAPELRGGGIDASTEFGAVAKQAEEDQMKLDQLAIFQEQEFELISQHTDDIVELERVRAEQNMEFAKAEADFKRKQMSSTLGATSSFLNNIFTLTGSKNKALFKSMKAFAIGQALMDTYAGATKALSSVPFPFNIAAMGSVIAAGLAQVQQIRSQTISGGGGGGAISAGGVSLPSRTGGGANAQGIPVRLEEEQEKPTQTINLTIKTDGIIANDTLAGMAEQLVKTINDAGENNILINQQVIEGS